MAENVRCVICGSEDDRLNEPDREGAKCPTCGSTWRTRATTLALLDGLGFPRRPLDELPLDLSRIGIGIGDNAFLAAHLAARFRYTNTFLDRFPVLDLLAVPSILDGSVEFVLCSDVLEHVPPPAIRATDGIARMLRPGGFAVISVPYFPHSPGPEGEHYPELETWDVSADGTVRWRDSSGVNHHDRLPEWHEGDGLVLAFRSWSEAWLIDVLTSSGFTTIEPLTCAPALGVPNLPGNGVYTARI